MRKLISVFLILWLPLFMQGAWAMSTHMLLEEAHISTSLEANQDAASSGMHCHKDNAKTHAKHSTHHCSHCIACAIVTASASFDTAPNIALEPNRHAVAGDVIFYTSPYLIPLVKPPIQS